MSDIHKFTARKLHNFYFHNEPFISDESIIFEIVDNSNYILQREEIIHMFKERVGAKDLDLTSSISNHLDKLVNHKKIARISHNQYSRIRK